MLRIAAAIVHYGRAEATLACLRALGESDHAIDVWIVDNGPPGSLDELELPRSFRLMKTGQNLGYGRALNLVASRLLDEPGHDALLCLNNDALVETTTISRLATALADDPHCAAAVPRIVMQGGEGALWYGGGEIDWLKGSARVHGVGGRADTSEAMRPRDVGFATGCALLLRLEALSRVGGFDARYFLYEEDVELSIRLCSAGWTLRYAPDAVVHHAGQGSQRAPDEPFVAIHRPDNPRAAQLTELQVCNRLLTVSRHADAAHRLTFGLWFPIYWARRCLSAALRGRLEPAAAVWRGIRRYRELRLQPAATALGSSDALRPTTSTTWSRS